MNEHAEGSFTSVVSATRDHDFHPDEADVRVFVVPPQGVLRCDFDLLVTECRTGTFVLRHYAFADRWFKVNVTTDLDGMPSVYGDDGFTFNCDIATPMLREGLNVYAVDLFLDVLVDRAGRTFEVTDREEFLLAVDRGLVSEHEAAMAEIHLEELLGIIRRGDLLSWLDAHHPFGPTSAPASLPMARCPISPAVAPGLRPSWGSRRSSP